MWIKAHWHLYDYAMQRITRLDAFRRMCGEGLSRRNAAQCCAIDFGLRTGTLILNIVGKDFKNAFGKDIL